MVNQYNYRSDNLSVLSWGAGDSEYKARLREEKRAQNKAKANRRLQEKAAKANNIRLRKQRESEARAILNDRGYTDIKIVSPNQRPAQCAGYCQPGPAASCAKRPQQYACAPSPARIAPQQTGPWANQGRSDARRADAPKSGAVAVYRPAAPVRVLPAGGQSGIVRAQAVKPSADPRYGYPVESDGTVKKSYLKAVNSGRSDRAIRADASQIAVKGIMPARPTPYQANKWVRSPGSYDIIGIDSPASYRAADGTTINVNVTYSGPASEKEARDRMRAGASKGGKATAKKRAGTAPKAPAKTAKKTPSKAPAKAAPRPAANPAGKKAPAKTAKKTPSRVPAPKAPAKKGSGKTAATARAGGGPRASANRRRKA